MKSVRNEISRWIQFLGCIFIWVIILLVTRTSFSIDFESIKKIPEAITVYVACAFMFTEWAWKWKIFRGWLVTLPIFEGTWQGILTSSWRGEDDQAASAIPIVLVIRQTYTTISCTLYTKESDSNSIAATLIVNEGEKSTFINYIYVNVPKLTLRERSAIHYGATMLRFIKSPERKLVGEFWTDRMSSGVMEVTFKSEECQSSFAESEN